MKPLLAKPYQVAQAIDKDGKPYKYQVHYVVSLNRAPRWSPAKSYLEARALAPLPEVPVR